MDKTFEEYFNAILTDIIAVCVEYVNNTAEIVYVYCFYDGGIITTDFFYRINGQMVRRNDLNDAVRDGDVHYDTSSEREDAVFDNVLDDLERLHALCRTYKTDMPVDIKMVYDVAENIIEVNARYKLEYTDDPVKVSSDIAMAWFEEILSEIRMHATTNLRNDRQISY